MRKKFKSKYRMIALLLCILLIGGMFPLGVFASEDPVISSVSEEVFDEKDTGNAGQKDGDEKPSQRNATEEPKDEGLKAEEPKAEEPKDPNTKPALSIKLKAIILLQLSGKRIKQGPQPLHPVRPLHLAHLLQRPGIIVRSDFGSCFWLLL